MGQRMPVCCLTGRPGLTRLLNRHVFIKLNPHQGTKEDWKSKNRKYPEPGKTSYDDDGHHKVKPEYQGG